ncbi:MAG: HAMP domain-containing sensor histidine kinase [Actinomycetota bacterium]
MSRPRRLSLRARMLVLLTGVTTVFLLIMGVVGSVVLASRLNGNFNTALIAEASRRPAQIAVNAGGYGAVEIVPGRPAVVITGDSPVARALARAAGQLDAAALARGRQLLTIHGGGARFRAVARLARVQLEGRPRLGVLLVGRPVSEVTSQINAFVVAELITGAGLLALLAIGGHWLIGRGLEPLDRMARAAGLVTSRGDLTARMPEAGGHTEVGRLGSAINTMLERIQQAFSARLRSEQKVREFAADASHELRTPLTTIRGYAELYRQGALGPAELPTAMRRIEQEAQRMSVLVAELLELARLDRTSSLDLAETDLAGLVRDAVADAVAVQPGRPVHAEVPPSLIAVVDERRIRQVLANLLGNVRAHTPPDTPATVRLTEADGGIVIEVADRGPGLAPQDAALAFDRFHRAAGNPSDEAGDDGDGRDGGDLASRSAGSGLGLSIVQAIAHAHGGEATLTSQPGLGTQVRIWLPATAVHSTVNQAAARG